MPKPLTAKSWRTPTRLEQAIVTLTLGVPAAGLWYCFQYDHPVHLDNPRLNLGLQAALLIYPMGWGLFFNLKPVTYESSDQDIILGGISSFSRLPFNWWMMLILWATPIFGIIELGSGLRNSYLPHAQELSTSPAGAIILMAVFFALTVFYSTILLDRSEIEPRISDEGLRTGILRFYKWEDIHHMSRHGNLYAIYHQANPALPAATLKVSTPGSKAILERFLTDHQVQLSNDPHPAYFMVRMAVVLGFMANLAVDFWLRWNTALSLTSIVVISFGMGIVMTLILEKYRGVAKYGKYKPVVQFDDAFAPQNDES